MDAGPGARGEVRRTFRRLEPPVTYLRLSLMVCDMKFEGKKLIRYGFSAQVWAWDPAGEGGWKICRLPIGLFNHIIEMAAELKEIVDPAP